MFLFAGMLGMLAVGAVAFVGLESGADELEPEVGDMPEAEEAPDHGATMDIETFLNGGTPAAADTSDAQDVPGVAQDAQMGSAPAGGSAFDVAGVMAALGLHGADAPDAGPEDQDATGEDIGDEESAKADNDPCIDWTITTGGEEGDTVTGTGGSDFLMGYAGGDLIAGGTGDDQIEGGAGHDSLQGDAGADTLHGEEGDDLLLGGTGDDDLYGHDGADTLDGGTGADSLTGGMGDDSLDGGEGDDALHGYHGHDTLDGGAGEDALFGGWGDDVISGGEDDETDYLNGGDGDDQITAGAGDIVTGGDGDDTVWLDGDAGGPAEITDFTPGEDNLLIEYGPTAATPKIGIEPDTDETDVYHVTLDGEEVALVHSPGGLGMADIALVPSGVL